MGQTTVIGNNKRAAGRGLGGLYRHVIRVYALEVWGERLRGGGSDRNGPRYADAITLALPSPTDDTREILALAQHGLGQIYRPGYPFSKCSILLMNLSQRGELTPDLFAPKPRRGAERLMAVIDQINRREGRDTVRIGRVPATPVWAMRREMLSQRYTTRWEEVIGVRG